MNDKKECCANCKLCLDLERWDYSDIANNGVKHEPIPGYVCMLFASEGLCIHMVGCNKENDICEGYTPKDERGNNRDSMF